MSHKERPAYKKAVQAEPKTWILKVDGVKSGPYDQKDAAVLVTHWNLHGCSTALIPVRQED